MLCVRCNKRPRSLNKKSCTQCLSYAKQYKILKDLPNSPRKSRLLKGLCGKCGKRPFVEGRRNCSECLAKENERIKRRNFLVWRREIAMKHTVKLAVIILFTATNTIGTATAADSCPSGRCPVPSSQVSRMAPAGQPTARQAKPMVRKRFGRGWLARGRARGCAGQGCQGACR